MSAPAPALERIDAYRWRLPRREGMRTEGLVFADRRMLDDMVLDESLKQVANVAHLPGIVGASMAMPDIHWGYGFPIGGVAAFDSRTGVVSPGGVGYDINCGVRLLTTGLGVDEVRPRLSDLVDRLYERVPSGLGSARKDLRLTDRDLDAVLAAGAGWAVARGLGRADDLACIEDGGRMTGARPDEVSARARRRGSDQLGTLGSGNHFLEVQYVQQAYDGPAAAALGLRPGTVTIMIHSGSRGLGHQVCDDYLDVMQAAVARHGIRLPDPQLCCAPLGSAEAERYLGAMCAAANFAFANRQAMAHFAREALADVFGRAAAESTGLVYDVAHNIARFEDHQVDGAVRTLCVHRKGATRALPPGDAQLPERYRHLGQPVLIPGDMGRCSFVLLGTAGAEAETFASTSHGAGRRLSRRAAVKAARGRDVARELADQGIVVRAASRSTMLEEIPEAYKDVHDVVDVVDGAGIGRKLAQLRPLGVIKG